MSQILYLTDRNDAPVSLRVIFLHFGYWLDGIVTVIWIRTAHPVPISLSTNVVPYEKPVFSAVKTIISVPTNDKNNSWLKRTDKKLNKDILLGVYSSKKEWARIKRVV